MGSLKTDKVVVNCSLLKKLMTYIEKLVKNQNNSCEETDFYILNPKKRGKTKKLGSLKLNLESNKLHRVLLKYSQLSFP